MSSRLRCTGGGGEKTPDMCPTPRNWASKQADGDALSAGHEETPSLGEVLAAIDFLP